MIEQDSRFPAQPFHVESVVHQQEHIDVIRRSLGRNERAKHDEACQVARGAPANPGARCYRAAGADASRSRNPGSRRSKLSRRSESMRYCPARRTLISPASLNTRW